MTDAKSLYERDFVAWTETRAEAPRAAAGGGSTEQLDWENWAEEVEGLGIPERRALHSQIRRIVCQLLKLVLGDRFPSEPALSANGRS